MSKIFCPPRARRKIGASRSRRKAGHSQFAHLRRPPRKRVARLRVGAGRRASAAGDAGARIGCGRPSGVSGWHRFFFEPAAGKIFSTCFLPPMEATFAHSVRTGGSRAQVGVAPCDRCRIGRGRALGGRACRRGAGCTARNRDRLCARRTGAIHLSRQAVLLVPLRLGGRRLVLVRLWHLCRRRLGRQLRLERLGRAATLPRRAGRTPVPLLAGALSAVVASAGHQLARQQRSDGG